MVLCKIRTEAGNERVAAWEDIHREIQTLDSPHRGTSPRDGAFVTMWFEKNGTDDEYMQCMPVYPKKKGPLQKLFGAPGRGDAEITAYTVEAGTGETLYARQVAGKEQVTEMLRAYFDTHRLPDTSGWTDTGII